MDRSTAKEVIKRLTLEINTHLTNYHTNDAPVVSDHEYDHMFDQLLHMENLYPDLMHPNSPTQKVGGPVHTSFTTRKHLVPMLSLSNTFDKEDLNNFIKKVDGIYSEDAHLHLLNDKSKRYRLEYKVDGLALSCRYENGMLDVAKTRGDGDTGEVVTDNAKTIINLPHQINQPKEYPTITRLVVRGEVAIALSALERLNGSLIEKGKKPFADARSAAAGTIRQLDSSIAAQRPLMFVAYELVVVEPVEIMESLTTRTLAAEFLELLGFDTVEARLAEGPNNLAPLLDINNIIEDMRREGLNSFPFEFDGVVVKTESRIASNKLGLGTTSPNWAVAYKFPDVSVITKLVDVIWQVGKFGTVTPVAVLAPVDYNGVTLRKASLYNPREINRLDLHLGDSVGVIRAAGVAPKIIQNYGHGKETVYLPVIIPTHCPGCAQALFRSEDLVNLQCVNNECPSIIVARLAHFVAPEAMDIRCLGPELLLELYRARTVTCVHEFYTDGFVKRLQGYSGQGIGDALKEKILNSIRASREVTMSRLIYALCIEHIGIHTAKQLARFIPTIDSLINVDVTLIPEIKGIGPAVLTSLQEYVNSEMGSTVLKGLDSELSITDDYALVSYALEKTVWCITGDLVVMSRDEAVALIQQHSGTVSKTLTGSVTHLLVGEIPSASKVEVATVKELPICTIDELMAMLD